MKSMKQQNIGNDWIAINNAFRGQVLGIKKGDIGRSKTPREFEIISLISKKVKNLICWVTRQVSMYKAVTDYIKTKIFGSLEISLKC